jgi:hypothetical protein
MVLQGLLKFGLRTLSLSRSSCSLSAAESCAKSPPPLGTCCSFSSIWVAAGSSAFSEEAAAGAAPTGATAEKNHDDMHVFMNESDVAPVCSTAQGLKI